MTLVSALVSTLIQVGIVFLLALAAWLIARRRQEFRPFVGLVAAPLRVLLIGIAIGLASAVLLLSLPGMEAMAGGQGSVAAELSGGTVVETAMLVAMAALLKTSFSEELLFRGVIGKRLISWLGFQAGNAIQAVLFGAVHLLLLLIPTATVPAVAMLVAFTTIMGWVNGWLNERLGGGSILPGWAVHGAANLLAYSLIALG
jgi:uncharacterized protein